MNTEFHTWAIILVYLNNHHTEDPTFWEIAKQTDLATIKTVSKVITLLKNQGLIKFEHKGKRTKYSMTDKGEKVAEYLSKIFTILK